VAAQEGMSEFEFSVGAGFDLNEKAPARRMLASTSSS